MDASRSRRFPLLTCMHAHTPTSHRQSTPPETGAKVSTSGKRGAEQEARAWFITKAVNTTIPSDTGSLGMTGVGLLSLPVTMTDCHAHGGVVR